MINHGKTCNYRRVWEYNSWSEYWKNIELIRDFEEKYPNE